MARTYAYRVCLALAAICLSNVLFYDVKAGREWIVGYFTGAAVLWIALGVTEPKRLLARKP